MKRVRYVVGAAALAPVAMGTALPAAAHAATVSPKAKTKSVVLDHAAATPNFASCIASTLISASATGSLISRFAGYETTNMPGYVCIGTLYANRHFLHNNCVNITFHVDYARGGFSLWTNRVCGAAGGTQSTHHTFRKEFPAGTTGGANYVNISVTSTYSQQVGMAVSSHGAIIGGHVG